MSCKPGTPGGVDEYIARADDFARAICERLRALIRAELPEAGEALKWGNPCYTGQSLICGFGAYQSHVALIFWRGSEMNAGSLPVEDTNAKMMMRLHFRTVSEVKSAPLRALLQQARKLDAAGQPTRPRPRTASKGPVAVPPELEAALAKHPAARRHFTELSPSCRREYATWIAEAKRLETREKRCAEAVAMLTSGRKPHEKWA